MIDLFRSREECASKEINHQLDQFCHLQAQLSFEEEEKEEEEEEEEQQQQQ